MINRISRRLVVSVEIAMLILGVLTTTLYYLHFQKIFGNTSSRMLLVLGPYLNMGKPYTDLWEFVPPGFLMFANAWVGLFGWGMFSLRSMQILILAMLGISFLLVVRKIANNLILEFMIFLSFVLIVYSPIVQSDMLSIDMLGTTFALLGLACLVNLKNKEFKLVSSAALFFLASQMKEIFTFSVVALIPYYLYLYREQKWGEVFKYKKRKEALIKIIKTGLLSFAGILLVGLFIGLYLSWSGAWGGYFETLKYKLMIVQPMGNVGDIVARINFIDKLFSDNFFHWHSYLSVLFFINTIFLLFIIKPRIKLRSERHVIHIDFRYSKVPKFNWEIFSVAFFSVGIFLGMIMYGQYSVDVRMIPVASSMLLLIAILLLYPILKLEKLLNKRFGLIVANIILCMFLVVYVSPQRRVIGAFFHQIKVHFYGEILKQSSYRQVYVYTSSDEVEKYIEGKTDPENCIINPYGWEVAETYIYSHRKPCTRQFISNIAIQTKWQTIEYQKQMLNNPPSVIFYNLNIIDLNVENFAKNVFNYPQIIKNCYTADIKYANYPYQISGSTTHITLYWKRSDMNSEEFDACYKKYAMEGVAKI